MLLRESVAEQVQRMVHDYRSKHGRAPKYLILGPMEDIRARHETIMPYSDPEMRLHDGIRLSLFFGLTVVLVDRETIELGY